MRQEEREYAKLREEVNKLLREFLKCTQKGR